MKCINSATPDGNKGAKKADTKPKGSKSKAKETAEKAEAEE